MKVEFVRSQNLDFTQFLKESEGDCRLYTANGEFEAHRAILAIRSPLLKRIFQRSAVGDVAFANVTNDDLQDILRLCYTGTLETTELNFLRISKLLKLFELEVRGPMSQATEEHETHSDPVEEEKENSSKDLNTIPSKKDYAIEKRPKRVKNSPEKWLRKSDNTGPRMSEQIRGSKTKQKEAICPICEVTCDDESAVTAHINRKHLAKRRCSVFPK